MKSRAGDLAHCLARQAEAVCRQYLPAGKRAGRYWMVGNIHGDPGQSLAVRLEPSDTGAAGKWTDAATGEHGDLLDLIKAAGRLTSLRDAMNEAELFLGLGQTHAPSLLSASSPRPTAGSRGSADSARRLLALCRPIAGTLAETYLRARGVSHLGGTDALRFHPRCFYRADDGQTTNLPTLVAAVTDPNGQITGCHRTYLEPGGLSKAAVAHPRRAIGTLVGNGVRVGWRPDEALVVSEGIEDVLSVRDIAPSLPGIAALSASHLAALSVPSSVRRLYIALDQDPAGENAARRLADRAAAEGIRPLPLRPVGKDWNQDLTRMSRPDLLENLAHQLVPEDATRFLPAYAAV